MAATCACRGTVELGPNPSGAWYLVQGAVRFYWSRLTSPLILPTMPLLPANTDPHNPNGNHHHRMEREDVVFWPLSEGNRNDNNQLRVSNFRNQSMVWLCGTHCNTYWWILWAEYSTDTSNTTINWIWAPQAWSIQHRHGEGPSTLPGGWSWIGENMTNDFWLFQCTLLKRIECRLEE